MCAPRSRKARRSAPWASPSRRSARCSKACSKNPTGASWNSAASWESDHARHVDDPGAEFRSRCDAGARSRRADVRRGCRLFRRRLPRHRRPAEKVRSQALLRYADFRRRHYRHGHRHGGLWPQAGGGNPVRRLHPPAFDQLVSEAARLRYRSNGEFWAPITVRAPYGGGIFGGQTHSQSPEAIFAHITGLKTVIPSNPYDAKGLLIAAIESNDPVIFLEPKRIYNGPFDGHHERPVTSWAGHPASEVPLDHYTVPLGSA